MPDLVSCQRQEAAREKGGTETRLSYRTAGGGGRKWEEGTRYLGSLPADKWGLKVLWGEGSRARLREPKPVLGV